MILGDNARHQDYPKPLPEEITESPENYATLKRPLPESKSDRIYVYDTEYRCDPWDERTIYDANTLSFKIQIPNLQNHPETVPEVSSPLSPILKKTKTYTDSTRHGNVYTNRRREHQMY